MTDEQTPADKAEEILDGIKGAMSHTDAIRLAAAYAAVATADALAEIAKGMHRFTEAIEAASDQLEYLKHPEEPAPGSLFEQTKPKSLEDLHALIDGPSPSTSPTSEIFEPPTPVEAAQILSEGGSFTFDPNKLTQPYPEPEQNYQHYLGQITAQIPLHIQEQTTLHQEWTRNPASVDDSTGTMKLSLDWHEPWNHPQFVKEQQEYADQQIAKNLVENPSKPPVKKSSEAENTIEAPTEPDDPLTPVEPKNIPEAIQLLKQGWAIKLAGKVPLKQIEAALDSPDFHYRKRVDPLEYIAWISQMPGSKIPAPNDPEGQKILDQELGLYTGPSTVTFTYASNSTTGSTTNAYVPPITKVTGTDTLAQWQQVGHIVDGDEIQKKLAAKKAELEEALDAATIKKLSGAVTWQGHSAAEVIADMKAVKKIFEQPLNGHLKTYEEQKALHDAYIAGTGSAALPGQSQHGAKDWRAILGLDEAYGKDTGQQEPDEEPDFEDAWTEEHPGEDFPTDPMDDFDLP